MNDEDDDVAIGKILFRNFCCLLTPGWDGDLLRECSSIKNSSGMGSIELKKYLEAYGEVPNK